MIANIMSWFSGKNFSLWSFSSIGITDVIDILIVAYAIYKIVSWIRQTRAWSLFKGIAAILLVMGLASVFNLNTTYWLLSNTVSVGLIAIIVIFHPELRKALEQIGQGRVFGLFVSQERYNISRETVTEILTAAKTMSKERTGALIVMEREVSLKDLAATGIPIDATVSSQLLQNIFVNKTPLHDGAVIIKNNRIVAACCILPLTSEEIGKELGTRHRAAVGASETADADVLVVSEETGRISVAKAGKLYKSLTEQQLFNLLLRSSQEGEVPDKKKLLPWKGRHNNAGKD